jgi:hypothetical protein
MQQDASGTGGLGSGSHNRQEKEEEKRGEKDEKNRGEKQRDEKWRRDPISAAMWAAVLIWVGLSLLAESTNVGPNNFTWWNTGAVIATGIGAIFVVAAIVRLVMPEYRRHVTSNFIIGLVLLAAGLSNLTSWNWEALGAAGLIAIGVIIIVGGVFRRRK